VLPVPSSPTPVALTPSAPAPSAPAPAVPAPASPFTPPVVRESARILVIGPVVVSWPVDAEEPGSLVTAPEALAPPAPPDHLTVAWSVTGRARPGGEVAFPPGRRFRTLEVMTADPRWARIVLLREGQEPDAAGQGPSDSYVRDALWRLAEAVRRAPHHIG
jgi:hypothetical protein